MSYNEWFEKNYQQLQHDFIEYLVNEFGYARQVAENCDDGRDEFIEREYGMYITYTEQK